MSQEHSGTLPSVDSILGLENDTKFTLVRDVPLWPSQLCQEPHESSEAAFNDFLLNLPAEDRETFYKGGQLAVEEWLQARTNDMAFSAAETFVERYLQGGIRKRKHGGFEAEKLLNAFAVQHAVSQCPILHSGAALPFERAETFRWLLFSTEAWAQRQPAFLCERLSTVAALQASGGFCDFGHSVNISLDLPIQRTDVLIVGPDAEGLPDVRRGFFQVPNRVIAVLQTVV